LTGIVAPLIFTTGIFAYFTSEAAVVRLPGAPFFLGSFLNLISVTVLFILFRRLPRPDLAASTTEGTPTVDPTHSA
jgi:MFS transporter, DHA1 family, tetracycline resistance protein